MITKMSVSDYIKGAMRADMRWRGRKLNTSEMRMKRSVRDGEKGRKLTGGVYGCLWVQ